MPKFKVLLTDYAWSDLDIERRTLAEIDAELIVAPRQDVETLTALAVDADAIMTNWAKVPAAVIQAGPKCKIVSRLGIGLDNIDVATATARKIVVTNIPDYCIIEVAEHALALLLALARKIGFYHQQTMTGRYDLQAGPALRRIEGQTLGIVGLGNIGGRLAEKALALGLKVLATTRTPRTLTSGVRRCELDELLAQSDYVSLHLPLTAETRHLIGKAQLARMKPTAYLINTARGGLIDNAALSAALESRTAGRSGPGRARSRAAGPRPAALERSPRDRHAARGVCLARVAGQSAHADGPAGSNLPDRRPARARD